MHRVMGVAQREDTHRRGMDREGDTQRGEDAQTGTHRGKGDRQRERRDGQRKKLRS